MFVIYGVTLVWVAISNATSGGTGWIAFSLFQLLMAFQVFRQYVRFRRAEDAQANSAVPQRASRAFPPIGCALGMLSLIGLVAIFVGAVLVAAWGEIHALEAWGWVEGLLLDLASVGFAVALASLLSSTRASGWPSWV